MTLTTLEWAVLTVMLNDPRANALDLSSELPRLEVKAREYTGVGFYTTFDEGEVALASRGEMTSFEIQNAQGNCPSLANGIGFTLFIRGGRMYALEGYTFGEPWPSDESKIAVRIAKVANLGSVAHRQ